MGISNSNYYFKIDGTTNQLASNTTNPQLTKITINEGETLSLIADKVIGATYEWKTADGKIFNKISLIRANVTKAMAGEYILTIKRNTCIKTAKITVIISNKVTPTFTTIATICKGSSFTLPDTSSNGIKGTWSPEINNQKTTEYTFTPNSGQNATSVKMTVKVTEKTIPEFNQIADICKGGTFTLPNQSTNGIKGTWSPKIDNTKTTKYKFTPNDNQCAETTEITVTVIQPANAGTDGTLTIKYGETPTEAQLFKALQGTPDTGGTWSNVGNTYTYSVKSNSPCNEIATAKVTVIIEKITVSSITLDKTSATIIKNNTLTLIATILPNNASIKDVTWKSSNSNIVSVDSNGKIKGLKAGTATITATTKDGLKNATCKVTVIIAVSGIKLSAKNLEIKVGETATLTANVLPTDATNKNIEWSSTNTSIATIDNNGKILGVAMGKTNVRAKTIDGDFYADCEVTVSSSTAVDDIEKNKVIVWAVDGKIYIKNAKVGDIVQIYNIIGNNIYNTKLQTTLHSVSIKIGTYIVRVGNTNHKVIVF